jgi:hypothetical protein
VENKQYTLKQEAEKKIRKYTETNENETAKTYEVQQKQH